MFLYNTVISQQNKLNPRDVALQIQNELIETHSYESDETFNMDTRSHRNIRKQNSGLTGKLAIPIRIPVLQMKKK